MKPLAVLMLISLLPALSGCLAVAAGAGAGGATGYYISKEDRPSAQVEEDDGIANRVRSRFAQDPQLSPLDIHIDSYQDIVTLSGNVPDGAMAQRVIDTAHAVDGVKGVRSELTVH
jgi:hyperosmotically inducible protein